MPLYELWETGTASEIVFAAVHCTGGDVLIALCAIVAALLLTRSREWPTNNNRRILVTTILIGFAYTAFSEWLNIEVRGAWAYRDLMPVVPVINMGLSPALQWLFVPFVSYWWAVYFTERIAKKWL